MANEPRPDWEKEARRLDRQWRAEGCTVADITAALSAAHASGAREAEEKRARDAAAGVKPDWLGHDGNPASDGAALFAAAGVLSYSLLTLRCGLTMDQAGRVITVVRSAIYDLARDASRVGGKETT